MTCGRGIKIEKAVFHMVKCLEINSFDPGQHDMYLTAQQCYIDPCGRPKEAIQYS